MHALRNMGEGNSLLGRSRHLNQREIFAERSRMALPAL